MGMKSLMCEILVDKQKELIESFESQLKAKNKIIIKEAKRANEMFKLSYNRKLQIKEQQAEINRLKTTLKNLKELMLDPDCVGDRGDIYVMVRAIDKALNGVRGNDE